MLRKNLLGVFVFTLRLRYPLLKRFNWLYRCCHWCWAGLSRPNTLHRINQLAFFTPSSGPLEEGKA